MWSFYMRIHIFTPSVVARLRNLGDRSVKFIASTYIRKIYTIHRKMTTKPATLSYGMSGLVLTHITPKCSEDQITSNVLQTPPGKILPSEDSSVAGAVLL